MSVIAALLAGLAASTTPPAEPAPPARTMADILAASTADDWRTVDPTQLLRMDLGARGEVWIELNTDYAPAHARNIRTLVQQGYFDGLAIVRAQDNFVVQWGDPQAEDVEARRDFGKAKRSLAPEFTRSVDPQLEFTRLPDADGYAPEVGFSGGYPVGRDPQAGTTWLAHCYGTLGVGRDTAADSGSGAELYVVTGHAPRQLDRNITVAGRVLRGMEHLAALPRGPAPMGFYTDAAERTSIVALQLASSLPAAQRPALQVMRTDTPTFRDLIEARRNRRDAWYHVPAGHIDLCNVPIPVRDAPAASE